MTDSECAADSGIEPHGQYTLDWGRRRVLPLDGGPYCWHWADLIHYCSDCDRLLDVLAADLSA